tara:strand:- start:5385 stop:5855 length:471 start_codon:yes stop_codon:yes gene_type:complete
MPSILPTIKDDYSPLRELIKRAIRRFGDFSAASIDGDVELMFIEFANQIVDDYTEHPYYDGRENVGYYTSADECRAIQDPIILSGLIAHYSFQQASEKTQGYQALYYKTLNQLMWKALNGNTPIDMRPTDGGSNKSKSYVSNVTNGLKKPTPETTY